MMTAIGQLACELGKYTHSFDRIHNPGSGQGSEEIHPEKVCRTPCEGRVREGEHLTRDRF